MSMRRILATVGVSLGLSASTALSASPAMAQANTSDSAVASSRSFPKQSAVRSDRLKESVSTDVRPDPDWGGVGDLEVPLTESQAEKDAEAKAQQEEEAREQARASRQTASMFRRTSASASTAPLALRPPGARSRMVHYAIGMSPPFSMSAA